jgi:signal transduction histidine kinase
VVLVRRAPWQLLAAAVLLVLLGTLATLQYRWLGEVSAAERERMRASLRTRTAELAQAFDGELTRMYMAFRIDPDALDTDAAAAVAAAYASWQASAPAAPGLVRGLYLVEGPTLESARVRRFDPDRRLLETADWPSDLAASVRHPQRFLPRTAATPLPLLMADAVDARVPALMIALPHLTRSSDGPNMTFLSDLTAPPRLLIVALDPARLRDEVLEPLVARYFGAGDASEYLITIVRRDDPSLVVFSSGSPPVDASGADVTTGLFDLRMEEFNRLDAPGGLHAAGTKDRVAITIVRRAPAAEGSRVLMAGGDAQGAWLVRARHRSGSLETIVARSRRRNLAISLGVLGLLGASFVLVMGAWQRQQRLARQQMEFVAAVSHELRTPLAVICSAGENLADGVVADRLQVKKYGVLIETEGRRLGDMVERVMAFAGISAGSAIRARGDVAVATVIADAVGAIRADARARGVTIAVDARPDLPPVSGDVDALRSAIQNIVGNAVKYSPEGASVKVAAAALGSGVQIVVTDRGLGIDREDLPHIFKPFFRGRRAVDAQVRGSGIGLSVVRHVVHAHQGTIDVDSRAGEGTTVTVVLPAGAGRPIVSPGASPEPVAGSNHEPDRSPLDRPALSELPILRQAQDEPRVEGLRTGERRTASDAPRS